MIVDHWLGDESGIDDPAAFFGSTAAALIVAAFLFGRVIPHTKRHPERAERAARQGIVCSALGLVTLPAIFLGFPVVLGGAGVALGLLGRDGRHRALATAFGPGDLGRAHAPDEWIGVDELVLGARAYARAICAWCGAAS